jgi:RNA polymerase sigma-70 factor (ECF subfamily)
MAGRRCSVVESSEAVADLKTTEAKPEFDLETTFRLQYGRISRVISRVVMDHARAEELAVEVFLKLARNPQAQGEKMEGWLYRTALRVGLDELRRRERRSRYERLFGFTARVPTPEEIHTANEERKRVRFVLGSIPPRQAELLLLRSLDLTYNEIASALELNPASVGTLIGRAQESFKKGYIKRHGQK